MSDLVLDDLILTQYEAAAAANEARFANSVHQLDLINRPTRFVDVSLAEEATGEAALDLEAEAATFGLEESTLTASTAASAAGLFGLVAEAIAVIFAEQKYLDEHDRPERYHYVPFDNWEPESVESTAPGLNRHFSERPTFVFEPAEIVPPRRRNKKEWQEEELSEVPEQLFPTPVSQPISEKPREVYPVGYRRRQRRRKGRRNRIQL